ncbi:MAG: restriction endonuclease subunit S [Microcystaceae cyanobacterium]
MINQIKNVTENWQEIKIGNLCKLINGRAFKPTEWTETGFPIIRIQNLNDVTKPFNYFNGSVDEKHKITNGDVLISWSGTPGTSFGAHFWNRGDAVLNQHIFKVDVNSIKCLKQFFVYAINWRLDELIRKSQGGVGLRHITKGNLENTTIPIPYPNNPKLSLDIQQRIVARIESLFGEIKQNRLLLEQMRLDTDLLLPNALDEVVDRLDSKRQTLLDVIQEKPRNGWSPKCDNDPNGVPVLKLGAVLRFQYNPDEIKRTSLSTDENAHYWLEAGDILISRSNTLELVGHASIYSGIPYPCIYPDLMMRFRVNPNKADSKFLIYWLQSKEVRRYVQTNASGASPTMKKIKQETVCNIPFPIISVEEQSYFAYHLDAIQQEVNKINRIIKEDEQNLKYLEQAILEKAFRGEL